jgi:hypothetical protein
MPAKHALNSAQDSSPNKAAKMDHSNGHETNGTESHQYQAGKTTHRDIDQWKHRAPYRIHENGDNFNVKWKGKCHCGKVEYQLSREKPLKVKYCHCTTCQRLHGVRIAICDR